MRANTQTLEQQATISSTTAGVQVVRDGFFLPAQAGMALLPGDRVVAESGARAVIEFTGVNDALVIENAAAATFNLEVVEPDQPPQWIASDLFGQGVYFDSNAPERVANANASTSNLFGLFGPTTSAGADFPLAEAAVGLLAVGAIAGDYSSDDTRTTTESSTTPPPSGGNTDGNGSGGDTGGNGGDDGGDTGGNDGGDGGTNASPLDPLLNPIGEALDTLFAAGGINSPLSTQATETTNSPGNHSGLPAGVQNLLS
ncbi:MAG TPA: hypothetical protein VFV57_08955 [Limnobacter sp.]|nr:hypothetical protein [Limnobacter sp.]